MAHRKQFTFFPYLTSTDWTNSILPNVWHSNTNDCIGNNNNSVINNDIWQGWYMKMDNLIAFGLPSATVHSQNADLTSVSWDSYGPNAASQWGSTQNYFHGGFLTYGDCGCF